MTGFPGFSRNVELYFNMARLKEIGCLDNFHGAIHVGKQKQFVHVYISVVDFNNRKGIVLARDAGHPETGNPVLITGPTQKLTRLAKRIGVEGEWPFMPKEYSGQNFPGCKLTELVPAKTGELFETEFEPKPFTLTHRKQT